MLRLSIAAHDAGGANVLKSTLKCISHILDQHFLGGPSVPIFSNLTSNPSLITDPSEIAKHLATTDLLLTSTSDPPAIEINAIKAARLLNIPSISILDHWANYKDRFIDEDTLTLPDVLWVTDPFSFNLATKEFPDAIIYQIPNFYILEVSQQILKTSPLTNERDFASILFLSEPMHKDNGFTEFDAFDFLLQNIHLVSHTDFHVTLRPHPSDVDGKYDQLIHKYASKVSLSSQDLYQDIASADIVCGCHSMALYVAFTCGKTCYSVIPDPLIKCKLPYPGIIQLSSLPNVSLSPFANHD